MILWGPYGMPKIEADLATCNPSILHAVLLLPRVTYDVTQFLLLSFT